MDALATAANIAQSVAVLVAVLFGVTQVVMARRDGKQRSTVELVRALQAPGFAQAHQRVMDLPRGLSREGLQKAGAFDDATTVAYFYESLGVLAHRGVADTEIVLDLYHVDSAWARLSGYVDDARRAQKNEHLFEWFQWLAQRDAEHSAREGPAAYQDPHAHR